MASKEDNRSRIVIVHGLAQDATVDSIQHFFEKSLRKAGCTDEFDVVYPIHECRGITVADPNRPAAALLFSDHIPVDQLCETKFTNIEVQPLKNQVFLQVSATINKHIWDKFHKREEANDILAKLQDACMVNVKHEKNGDVVIRGLSFQIAVAEEMLMKICQEKYASQSKTLHPASSTPMETNGAQHQRSGRSNAEEMRSLTPGASSTAQQDPQDEQSRLEPGSMGSMNHSAAACNDLDSIHKEGINSLTNETQASVHGSYSNQPRRSPTTGQEGETGRDVGRYFENNNSANGDAEASRHKLALVKETARQGTTYGNDEKGHPITDDERPNHSNQSEHTNSGEGTSHNTARSPVGGTSQTGAGGMASLPTYTKNQPTLSPLGPDGKASPRMGIGNHQSDKSKIPRHRYSHDSTNPMGMSSLPPITNPEDRGIAAEMYNTIISDHTILIYVADITKVRVDAMISASGSHLSTRYGVARAIAEAAGSSMVTECKNIIQRRGYLKEGEIEVTTGGNLCKMVLHAVGTMSTSHTYASRSLQITFSKCLDAAEEKKMRSIAIPAIGSGTSDLPGSLVAKALCVAVSDFCSAVKTKGCLKEIHLVDIDREQTRETNRCFQQNALYTSISYPSVSTNISGAKDPLSSQSGSPLQSYSTAGTQPNAASSSKDPRIGEKDDCPICLETIVASLAKSLDCGHKFCKKCIDRSFEDKKACPICGALYGEITGIQPTTGTMNVGIDRNIHLSGYERYDTIVIGYYFPPGFQTSEHPNPGKRYRGTQRTAYLPDNREGRDILQLLQRAFIARLVFTIGQSVTTGLADQVTWNDIHHKTSAYGGSFSYPDSTYLSRVKDELAAKGIK